ncbi:YafY family transcriptional regulator [Actinocorallia sp. API 0066]|uniref:helix-turn-helix transcriptional regulator n=1 Tax=Actinocorallia sp. API 0066 TaxID=2896846 RepID=UPI001E41BD98|nr:YafY family protein [Actinocorallia sp. API 0066]MCD0447740.1 YafY family transcriptional regulator [Actinocorallia sp. API 0066]
MSETAAQLLRLLRLLQVHRDWTGGELAERLGVTPRTIRRYVDRLRTLGYPVHAVPGVAGGYRLGSGAVMPPLLLDDEEAVAIAVGLRTAAGGTVAGLEETAIRVLAKLEQIVPARLRESIEALSAVTLPLTGPGAPTVGPDLLTALAASCRAHEKVKFSYRTHAGEVTTRTVEPYRLVHTGRRWYLLGYDVAKDDWRTFRADRISLPLTPGTRFRPRTPPAEDLTAYVSQKVASAPYRYQARVLMHAPADRVAERIPPTAGRIEVVSATSCILHSGANSLDGLALHIGMVGADFAVLDPPELREEVRRIADRFTRASRTTQA